MTTEEILHRSLERIRSGNLQNEAQVVQAVIVPILRSLDWDDSDPGEFVPQFAVDFEGGGRGAVDCALMGASGPLVFVEAKNLGHADDKGVDQVFRYAANRGVPFLILSDGNIWDFYLSMAEGMPAERRFYRLELQREDKIAEHARFFEKFLHKSQIINNTTEARLDAEQLRSDGRQLREARDKIPVVWRNLLETLDESLCSLIADGVESECGTRPDLDDIEEFLQGIPNQHSHPPQPTTSGVSPGVTPPPSPTRTPGTPKRNTGKIVGFVLDGKPVETRSGNRTLAELIKEFQRRDSGFMERFSAQTAGRTRRLVATTRDGLYDEVHLRDHSLDLENGWWFGTNISSSQVRKHIATACKIVGVQLGSQLTLIER